MQSHNRSCPRLGVPGRRSVGSQSYWQLRPHRRPLSHCDSIQVRDWMDSAVYRELGFYYRTTRQAQTLVSHQFFGMFCRSSGSL